MLKIELRPGESVSIGGIAVVTLEEKSGKVARLSIEADKSVKVTRVAKPTAAQFAAEGGITGKAA
jgi:sRNA-binding carbon storage regulator CsrA